MNTEKAYPKTALVLMNLGSPDSTQVEDVRRYLKEFLMDEYVIDYPYVFRYALVNWIISKFRAPNSAKAYQKVWTAEGSPLIVKTKQLAQAVREKTEVPVYEMMRYGSLSPREIFARIKAENPEVKTVQILPLYPHWTMSSYETAVVYCKKIHKQDQHTFELSFIDPFYDKQDYINALANSIRPYLDKPFDTLMFSYHGIPVRHIRKDMARKDSSKALKDFTYPELNYQDQCIKTSQLVAEKLGLNTDQFMTTFQSRLRAAGNKWLQPPTASVLEELPGEGKKRILIVCPAFINDCLETLEEIAIEGRHSFLESGGEEFTYIPCLNDHPDLVKTIIQWTKTNK